MISTLLGSKTRSDVLMFLAAYGEGYAREIAQLFGVSLSPIQGQLLRFEKAGLLVSRMIGRTRLYTWNPRYPFLGEIQTLMSKVLAYLPNSERKLYFSRRRRPRRSGKP